MSNTSHFFTNTGVITQSAAQAFGPFSGSEAASKFRVTNKFSLSANTMAFAICTGHVLIQPQTSSTTKVNLILRPYIQPFEGLKIKYIVYRGLLKADFFTTASSPLIKAALSSESDFINKINADFDDFYADLKNPDGSNATKPTFNAKFIGFDTTLTDTSIPLYKFFFKDSDFVEAGSVFDDYDDFELPLIQQGKSLGNFAMGDCGIDIVLDYGDYVLPNSDEFVLDLAYARAADALIDVSATTLSAIQKKRKREQVFQFLDIAAFYGAFINNDGVVITDVSGTKTNQTGTAIYTNIVSLFTTKNNWYIYIKSDRGRSYNFYDNYLIGTTANSLKIGTSATNTAAAPYDNHSWPLLIINASQNHNLSVNSIYLNLVTDNNPNTMLYVANGMVDGATNNFQNASTLVYPIGTTEFGSGLTQPIILSNNATGNSGSKVPIANFTQLIYQGKTYSFVAGQALDEQNQLVDVYAEPDFFDDVFDLINASNVQKTNNPNIYNVVNCPQLKLINFFDNGSSKGIAASQSLIINDLIDTGITASPNLARVTYVAEAAQVFNNPVSLSNTISSNTKTSMPKAIGIEESKTYKLPSPYFYSLQLFNDGGQTVTGVILNTNDGSIPNQVILGITKTENDAIKALITTNNLANARLFLINLFGQGETLTSADGVNFQKYKLGVVGELADGSLKLFLPTNDILVHSLDNKYHHSKGYSEYMVEDENELENNDYYIAE